MLRQSISQGDSSSLAFNVERDYSGLEPPPMTSVSCPLLALIGLVSGSIAHLTRLASSSSSSSSSKEKDSSQHAFTLSQSLYRTLGSGHPWVDFRDQAESCWAPLLASSTIAH